jgi:hypothetical protein
MIDYSTSKVCYEILCQTLIFAFKQMGILSHAWDVATSFMPMGGIVNKLGRDFAHYARKHGPGIIGQVARNLIPEHLKGTVSKISDAAVDLLPEGKVKGVLDKINQEMKSGEDSIAQQRVVLNPATSFDKPSAIGINPSVARYPKNKAIIVKGKPNISKSKKWSKSGKVALFG